MDIPLHEIVRASNNSHLTQDVLKALNTKLSDAEKQDFRRWLMIVNR